MLLPASRLQRIASIARRWNNPFQTVSGTKRWNSSQNLPQRSLIADTSVLYEVEQHNLNPEALNEQLCELVKGARFGAAHRLRLQMMEAEVEFQQHPVYETAAVSALQDSKRGTEEFFAWLSLVPDADDPLFKPTLRELRIALFKTGTPAHKLDIITRFGLLFAAKGYYRHFVPEIARLLVKFGSRDQIIEFFVQAEKAALQYALEYRPGHTDVEEAPKRYRRIGVEMCAEAGMFAEAVLLLQQERKYLMPDQTFTLLQQRMVASGKDLATLITSVHKMQQRDSLELLERTRRHVVFEEDQD